MSITFFPYKKTASLDKNDEMSRSPMEVLQEQVQERGNRQACLINFY